MCVCFLIDVAGVTWSTRYLMRLFVCLPPVAAGELFNQKTMAFSSQVSKNGFRSTAVKRRFIVWRSWTADRHWLRDIGLFNVNE